MKVQYIGAACILVEHKGAKVLCDPWLSDRAYYGSWTHPQPLSVSLNDFDDIDFIYISHIYPDHLDVATLMELPRVPILIASYPDMMLKQLLMDFKLNVLEVSAFALGEDFLVGIQAVDDIDSFAVFHGGDKVLLNTNDCLPLTSQRIDFLDHVDFHCVGYAGAGPWPQCFDNYDDEEKKKLAGVKASMFLQASRAAVKKSKARYYMPFAGEYVLQGKFSKLNRFRGIPYIKDVNLGPNTVRLKRMDWWNLETEQVEHSYAHQEVSVPVVGRLYDYEHDEEPEITEEFWDGVVNKWLTSLKNQGQELQQTIKINGMELGRGDSLLEITLDERLLWRLLNKQAHWKGAEIGSHLTFNRTPDIFDRGLHRRFSNFHI